MKTIYRKTLLILLPLIFIGVTVLSARVFWGKEGVGDDKEKQSFSAITPQEGMDNKETNVVEQKEEKKEFTQTPKSVPVIDNRSIITGKVLGYCILSASILDIQPDQTIYSLKVLIEKSEDIKGMRNFTKNKVGKLLLVYSKEKLSPELFNKAISARVTFRGDERSGSFWIWDIKVLKTELE